MDRFFDDLCRALAAPATRRGALRAAWGALAGALAASACVNPNSPSNNGGGGGGRSNCHCYAGNTYNFLTGTCCPSDTPYYYPGTHGGRRGCYASCPYIGDCGSSFQRC